MPVYTDQLGKTITLPQAPERIVSLVPSQTELLYDLGLADEVIGITKFCVHPAQWFRNKTRIGGTKTLNIEKIKSLQPDLIIANKEENVQEQVEALALDFPVWTSDIACLKDALTMIEQVGQICNRPAPASAIKVKIEHSLKTFLPPSKSYRTAYLIWKDPYMTVGGDTFISDMLHHAGYCNVFENHSRYPQITIEALQEADCELLFLSSEPYPFKQKHIDELKLQLPDIKMLVVDGEMFSWYGSRLLNAASYFKQLRIQIDSMV